MFAYVYAVGPDGRWRLPGTVTAAYGSRRTLLRYGLRHLQAGRYRLEIHNSPNRPYGPPDHVLEVTQPKEVQ